jgi:hypothetical protein
MNKDEIKNTTEETEYFLLNISVEKNKGNHVDEWIDKREIAPIFYGESTIKQIKEDKEKKYKADAYLFVETFFKVNKNAIIISIGNREIYFYKQKHDLIQYEKSDGHLVKGFDIELIKKIEIKECPLVLVTIKSNRFMGSGTFKKIDKEKGKSYYGNVRAIEYLLSGNKPEITSFEDYLFCLSSLEFETLIAKMYEENKWHVPAYKGGFIRNFDLFCKNNNEIKSLQIKLNLKRKHYNNFTNIYYCINSEINEPNIRNWQNIEEELKDCIITKKWLEQTLDWVDYVPVVVTK